MVHHRVVYAVLRWQEILCHHVYLRGEAGGGLDSIRALGLPEGTKFVVQHDGAKPHTGKGTEDKLNEAGAAYGVTWS